MRVLQLIKTSVGARWALKQTRELVKLGVEVHVALPPGPLVEKYQENGVFTHYLQTDFPLRKPWQVNETLTALRVLVDTIDPDIIHSHFVGTTVTMRLALGKNHAIPRVFQVPGPLHLEHPFYRKAEIGLAGAADFWIGSCHWTNERYEKSGISKDRLFLSYYGTDLEQHKPDQDKGVLRQELDLDADARIVGMVAYMYAPKVYLGQKRGLKGHEDLIDALAICQQRDRRIFGVFVGDAWNNAVHYACSVRAYGAKRCGSKAFFLGTRSDVPKLYPDIDVAVHPSHSENVGGAAESLMMARPTIATNVGGFPDVVIPGETGWLVPPKDPAALADAIMEALDDPAEAARRAFAGSQLVRRLFDVRRTAKTVAEIYEQVKAADISRRKAS